jgi:outer membrane protein assembly factor BamD
MAIEPRTTRTHSAAVMGLLLCVVALASCGRNAEAPDLEGSAEPDKVLYERAMANIEDGRHEMGRLTLQTLMNTYPESEYLAKAKLAIGDSYYKQGGASALLQSVSEYQDFITFFPFLDEAAYAQMQIGMAHFRRMEKPDRDPTEAKAAEAAFQAMLQKYPDVPATAEAQQRLREVQEVLAEGEFRVANFYFIRRADRAAEMRLRRLISRYPLYSQAGRANWMLATLYERNEGTKDAAIDAYARVAKEYPLSDWAIQAKAKLEELGAPVPEPDPAALARMEAEAKIPRERPGILGRSLGIMRSGPDVSMAARTGAPNMTPAEDANQDVLLPGASITQTPAGGAGSGVSVETVAPAQRPTTTP